jgi:hypothetical protein
MGEEMRKTWLLAACAVALAAFGLAACGGDNGNSADEDQITQAIVAAATSGDPSACTKYQTQKFVEQTSGGATGQAAVKSCEKGAAETVADKVDVSDIKVDGDNATATAAVTGSIFDGQTLDIALVKENGQWKLDEFKGFAEFNRDSFLTSFRHELATSEGGAPPAAVDCVMKQADGLSDEQLESVFTGSNQQAEEQLFRPCANLFPNQ